MLPMDTLQRMFTSIGKYTFCRIHIERILSRKNYFENLTAIFPYFLLNGMLRKLAILDHISENLVFLEDSKLFMVDPRQGSTMSVD